MKAAFAAFTCLLLANVAAAGRRKSLRAKAAFAVAEEPNTKDLINCEGNQFPLDPDEKYSALGLHKWANVFPRDGLREGLENNEEWQLGKRWNLTIVATSERNVSTMFSFAGGNGGFMAFDVPAGSTNKVISTVDMVKSLAKSTSFQYRGDTVITDHDVWLTHICLKPVECGGWIGTCPSGSHKTKDPKKAGSTDHECCERLECVKEDPCQPESKYDKVADYDTRMGGTPDACCTPKFCPEGICNSTKWLPSVGTGLLGSTPEECCEPRYCVLFDCSDSHEYDKPEMTEEYRKSQGSTHGECCSGKKCADFVCSVSSFWADKPDKDILEGNTFPECCEPLFCKDFDCGAEPTKYGPVNTTLADGAPLRGNTSETCCEAYHCQDHNCSYGYEYKTGYEQMLGTTDEECCSQKSCRNWECSDDHKWIHRAKVENAVEHMGWTDEECCDPIMCEHFACWPPDKYKRKPGDNLQGNTHEECCEPLFCKDYNCTGDWDGDGDSTTWHKKVDTNHHQYQGANDEDCCIPKYCSQYQTSFPSRWVRKSDPKLLGSTDFECYDPRMCSDYTCKDSHKVLKPCDWNVKGSSDAECCVYPHELEDPHPEPELVVVGR